MHYSSLHYLLFCLNIHYPLINNFFSWVFSARWPSLYDIAPTVPGRASKEATALGIYMTMPLFSFWDKDAHEYSQGHPTWDFEAWITDHYKPTVITYFWPVVIIETDQPPNPLPLTVGCASALFIPSKKFFWAPWTSHLSYDGLKLKYAKYRISSGSTLNTSFTLTHWTNPTGVQMKEIANVLIQYANFHTITYALPHIVVELCVDGREYGRNTLPNGFGGVCVIYWHDPKPYWPHMLRLSRNQLIDPPASVDSVQQGQWLFADHGPLGIDELFCRGVIQRFRTSFDGAPSMVHGPRAIETNAFCRFLPLSGNANYGDLYRTLVTNIEDTARPSEYAQWATAEIELKSSINESVSRRML